MQNRTVEEIIISVSQTSEQLLKYRDGELSHLTYPVWQLDTEPMSRSFATVCLPCPRGSERDVAVFCIQDGEEEWKYVILPN